MQTSGNVHTNDCRTEQPRVCVSYKACVCLCQTSLSPAQNIYFSCLYFSTTWESLYRDINPLLKESSVENGVVPTDKRRIDRRPCKNRLMVVGPKWQLAYQALDSFCLISHASVTSLTAKNKNKREFHIWMKTSIFFNSLQFGYLHLVTCQWFSPCKVLFAKFLRAQR